MTQYRVTVTIELEADDRKQAAMRAYSLPPWQFDVKDPASMSQEVELTEDEQQEALKMALEGTLFPGLPMGGK